MPRETEIYCMIKCPKCGYATKQGRSKGERGYYWSVLLPMIAEEMGEPDLGDVNELMKIKFNKKFKTINGENIEYGGSIERETTQRIEEIYSQIRGWAYHFLNLSIPLPNEIPVTEDGR